MKSFKEFITESEYEEDKQRAYPISPADKKWRNSVNNADIFDEPVTRKNIHDANSKRADLERGKQAMVKHREALKAKGYPGPHIHWRAKGK